jgi:hypothetical protein
MRKTKSDGAYVQNFLFRMVEAENLREEYGQAGKEFMNGTHVSAEVTIECFARGT